MEESKDEVVDESLEFNVELREAELDEICDSRVVETFMRPEEKRKRKKVDDKINVRDSNDPHY